jgi:hypothetical protein
VVPAIGMEQNPGAHEQVSSVRLVRAQPFAVLLHVKVVDVMGDLQ